MIEVTAEEAQAKGLAGVGFRVDPQVAGRVPLSLKKFSQPDKYLMGSGPPGVQLLAMVWAADGREGDPSAIEQAVRRHYVRPFHLPLVIGEPGEVMLGGKTRPALAFMTGQQLSRTAWCGVLVSGHNGSLLVTLGRGPGEAASMSCAEVLLEPSLEAFARTFTLL
jgi:hypothetical protein